MEQINLNKENPLKEFTLTAEDSQLLIQSIYVTTKANTETQWNNFTSKVKLIAELKYVVFDDTEGRFIDERKVQFPIYLLTDTYQDQPFFHLNKLIQNETFTLGIKPERKFYNTLKLELIDDENLDENYTLKFKFEKFKIED